MQVWVPSGPHTNVTGPKDPNANAEVRYDLCFRSPGLRFLGGGLCRGSWVQAWLGTEPQDGGM